MRKRHTTTTMVLALMATLAIAGCGDKKGNPPDDEGGELTQKTASCESFAECAREVLASTGLMDSEKEELTSCKFEAAQSHGTPSDQFEVAKQAVKRTCQ